MPTPRLTLDKLAHWFGKLADEVEIVEQDVLIDGKLVRKTVIKYCAVDKKKKHFCVFVFEKAPNVFMARSHYGKSSLLDTRPCMRQSWNQEMHGLLGGFITESDGNIYIEDNFLAKGDNDKDDESKVLFLWIKMSNTREKLNAFFDSFDDDQPISSDN